MCAVREGSFRPSRLTASSSIVNDDSPEALPASCDDARCCSAQDLFFPDYVQFPDDCPVNDLAVNLSSASFSLIWSEFENNRCSGLHSAPSDIAEWHPNPNIGSVGNVVGYGPYLPDTESPMYAGHQLPSSLSGLEDTLPLLGQNAFLNLDGDFPLHGDVFNSICQTIWLSELQPLEQVSRQEITETPTAGASTPTPNPTLGKRKRVHDSSPHRSEPGQKHCKPFQEYYCGWQECESAFDDVQQLR